MFPKRYADVVQRLRVTSGFLLLAAYCWLAQPSRESMAWGLPVALLGLVVRAWAAGHLEKNERLTDSGPYAWVRNPLYAGSLLAAAGLVVAARRWELAALFALVFLLVYLPVIQLEEQHLRKLFPAYRAYCEQVPALVPRGRRGTGKARFRWALYARNQEWKAALGFAAAAALLLAKLAAG